MELIGLPKERTELQQLDPAPGNASLHGEPPPPGAVYITKASKQTKGNHLLNKMQILVSARK